MSVVGKIKKRMTVKKLLKLMFSRVVIVGIMILLQFLMLLAVVLQFAEYSYIFYVVGSICSVVVLCHIIANGDIHESYKTAWGIVVVLMPFFGAVIYYIFSGNKLSKRIKRKMGAITSMTRTSVEDKQDVLDELKQRDIHAERQAAYIKNVSLCPPYKNTDVVYYPTGEALFEPLLCELEKAEKYIFMEYFIIAKGQMWDRIHDILRRKAAAGVDVRVIYDDMGCIMTLNNKFPKELEAEGIKCRVFHKFVPILDARQNNRDHRKICVIDGVTAFTGGINIADEYINALDRYGYWKDNTVMLKGEAVWSFSVMFLTMWDYLSGTPDGKRGQFASFHPTAEEYAEYKGEGFVQPYTDNPLDNVPLGKNVYMNLLYNAHDYVWIMTPYLIIDEQITQALCSAAHSGVDVRIIVPGIPDKKIVYETTKSYYPTLLANGVRIYEYTPGFVHAKTFVCDDLYATVGSVNLDYRSLYLHFECGAWMYKTPCIEQIKTDFESAFSECREVSLESCRVNFIRGLYRSVLDILSPLL
ncbi:MAG: cardiolipin synthase [Ruminococcaceae bacterium]|nr:cardiolipin synthase [Oscillospiraceae bacterium]